MRHVEWMFVWRHFSYQLCCSDSKNIVIFMLFFFKKNTLFLNDFVLVDIFEESKQLVWSYLCHVLWSWVFNSCLNLIGLVFFGCLLSCLSHNDSVSLYGVCSFILHIVVSWMMKYIYNCYIVIIFYRIRLIWNKDLYETDSLLSRIWIMFVYSLSFLDSTC